MDFWVSAYIGSDQATYLNAGESDSEEQAISSDSEEQKRWRPQVTALLIQGYASDHSMPSFDTKDIIGSACTV